eukprot:4505279-Pyramimonas_sp.AAC.1
MMSPGQNAAARIVLRMLWETYSGTLWGALSGISFPEYSILHDRAARGDEAGPTDDLHFGSRARARRPGEATAAPGAAPR